MKPFEKLRGCGKGSGEGDIIIEGPNADEEKIGLGIKGGKPLDDIGNGDVRGIDDGDNLIGSGLGEAENKIRKINTFSLLLV